MTRAEAEKFLKTPKGVASTIVGLRYQVLHSLPESRARSMVVTKLDEAALWLSIIGSGVKGFDGS